MHLHSRIISMVMKQKQFKELKEKQETTYHLPVQDPGKSDSPRKGPKQARWKSSRAEGRGLPRCKGQGSAWQPSHHLSGGGSGGGEQEAIARMSWSTRQFPMSQGSWNASLLPRMPSEHEDITVLIGTPFSEIKSLVWSCWPHS